MINDKRVYCITYNITKYIEKLRNYTKLYEHLVKKKLQHNSNLLLGVSAVCSLIEFFFISIPKYWKLSLTENIMN